MKPYVSEILTHNGKIYILPMPAKYREILDCVRVLDIKDTTDEDDVCLMGYKSLYVPEPDFLDSHYHVEQTAIEISKLSEIQVKALAAFCGAFDIPYKKIMGILSYININSKLWEENENGD